MAKQDKEFLKNIRRVERELDKDDNHIGQRFRSKTFGGKSSNRDTRRQSKSKLNNMINNHDFHSEDIYE
jgi:hypothetical protein